MIYIGPLVLPEFHFTELKNFPSLKLTCDNSHIVTISSNVKWPDKNSPVGSKEKKAWYHQLPNTGENTENGIGALMD